MRVEAAGDGGARPSPARRSVYVLPWPVGDEPRVVIPRVRVADGRVREISLVPQGSVCPQTGALLGNFGACLEDLVYFLGRALRLAGVGADVHRRRELNAETSEDFFHHHRDHFGQIFANGIGGLPIYGEDDPVSDLSDAVEEG